MKRITDVHVWVKLQKQARDPLSPFFYERHENPNARNRILSQRSKRVTITPTSKTTFRLRFQEPLPSVFAKRAFFRERGTDTPSPVRKKTRFTISGIESTDTFTCVTEGESHPLDALNLWVQAQDQRLVFFFFWRGRDCEEGRTDCRSSRRPREEYQFVFLRILFQLLLGCTRGWRFDFFLCCS